MRRILVWHIWKSTTLSPHILTISQDIGVELMENKKHEEINQCREFAKENLNILAEVFAQKGRQIGFQHQTLTIGD